MANLSNKRRISIYVNEERYQSIKKQAEQLDISITNYVTSRIFKEKEESVPKADSRILSIHDEENIRLKYLALIYSLVDDWTNKISDKMGEVVENKSWSSFRSRAIAGNLPQAEYSSAKIVLNYFEKSAFIFTKALQARNHNLQNVSNAARENMHSMLKGIWREYLPFLFAVNGQIYLETKTRRLIEKIDNKEKKERLETILFTPQALATKVDILEIDTDQYLKVLQTWIRWPLIADLEKDVCENWKEEQSWTISASAQMAIAMSPL